MCPSAFRVSGPLAQGGEGAGVNTSLKPSFLPWTGGDMRAKFYQDPCRGLDFN